MIEGQEGVSWEQWVALAQTCEEHGIETLFRSDHYLSQGDDGRRDALDAWTTLAGLAARTTELRLGTLVSPVTFRHPAVLAKSAVTVDHISSGRVEVGMGAGWMEPEHTAYGFPFPELSERLRLLAEWAGAQDAARRNLLHGSQTSTTRSSRTRRSAPAGDVGLTKRASGSAAIRRRCASL
jgi:alkanesulfonate monooxygenase SsuD/methylene tetrahydromethanopterin reductase-like flavin-dependent oxidoreductase (luciferase family)